MLQELWLANLYLSDTNSVFEKSLFNFRLLTVTEFKRSLQKRNPSIIYRDYEKFGNTPPGHLSKSL